MTRTPNKRAARRVALLREISAARRNRNPLLPRLLSKLRALDSMAGYTHRGAGNAPPLQPGQSSQHMNRDSSYLDAINEKRKQQRGTE